MFYYYTPLWAESEKPAETMRTYKDYNARYYDPALGLFLSPDTIVPDAGQIIDYHRYGYVRNSPLKYTDPTGHCPSTQESDTSNESSVGLGFAVTDASSVESLKGPSVQFGGTAGVGWLGAGAETTIFTNSETGETYRGFSVGGRANYPEPLKASIHTSVQTTGGWSGNLIDSTVDFAKRLWFGDFND
jgi:RHS repeat-associated protein